MSDLKAVIVQCGNEEYAIAVDAGRVNRTS